MHDERVLRFLDPAALVELTEEMVRFPTVNPPGDEGPLADFLAEELRALGLPAEVQPLAEGRANVIARLPGSGERPGLILSGHLDVVSPGEQPWRTPPFTPTLVGDRLYGRGTADMKGGCAALIWAAVAIQRCEQPLKGDLILALTAGEEVDSIGARRLVESGRLQGAGGVLIAEPTGLEVYVAEKGVVWLEIITHGRTAHGSMPELGVNAISQMAEVIRRLETLALPARPHPVLSPPSLNIGLIQGGVKINVVPDRCRLEVDIRTLPGTTSQDVLRLVQGLLDDLARQRPGFAAEVRLLQERPPVETAPEAPLVQTTLRIAQQRLGRTLTPGGVPYGTDGSVYAPLLGIPMVICGPGRAELAHQPDEYVEVPALLAAAEIYTLVIRDLLVA